jgi:myo-inositol-1(or 4)-monophosphatase
LRQRHGGDPVGVGVGGPHPAGGRIFYAHVMPLTDVDVAVLAAEAGAAVVRARYGGELVRHEKAPGDFATDADIEAERAILRVIRSARPDDGFVGEELGDLGSTDGRRWLVDPLCGTSNYAVRTPLVAVNVALRDISGVLVAAVADPFSGEVFWTGGDGAYVRRDGRDEPLTPSGRSRIVDLNLDAPPPDAHRIATVRMLGAASFTETFRPRVLSTTLALAWVAAGRRAAYVTEGDLEDSVHFASGIALCRAAGCVVTGLAGQPLHTGVGGLVAAADQETHAALTSVIEGLEDTPRQPGIQTLGVHLAGGGS